MKIRKTILTVLVLLNLILSGILIGSPIEQTYRPIIIITMIMFATYILIAENKIKIIRSKTDIFILLLGISTLIPLIFNTALSITSEINYIFKYISAILLYICIREHIINYPNDRKYIINTIISLSLILIILGIDNMSTKLFTTILEIINIKIQEIDTTRLGSIFCYANALAITIGISIILNNSNYLNEKDRIKKSLYGAITSFLITGLFLTCSRLVTLMIGVALIIYIILLKNKTKAIDIIKLLVISAISAYIYNSIFFNLINSQRYILFWIITIIINLVNYSTIYFCLGKKTNNIKISKVLIAITTIILIVVLILAITITGDLDLFKGGRKEYEMQLKDIKPNTQYSIKYEFKEIQIDEQIENINIDVIEMDENFDEIYRTNIEENDFVQKQQINIKTQEKTAKIKILFSQMNSNSKFVIERLTINDKEQILDYKLIPDRIEQIIQSTLMTQKGMSERRAIIEDGLKLAKENWLFGHGANAWEYEQYNYQQYYYSASQMHSFIVQLAIEYGIIAVISLVAIIGLTIYQYIKSEDKANTMKLSIFISFLLLITHSLIDFEMTYLYILQLFFVLIAMQVSFEKQSTEKAKTKVFKVVASIIVLLIVILYIVLKPYYDSNLKIKEIKNLTKSLYVTGANKKEIDRQIIKKYEDYFKLERHYVINEYMYFNYIHVIQRNLDEGNIKYVVEKLEELYNIIIKIKPKYQIDFRMEKCQESKLAGDRIKYSNISSEALEKIKYKYYQIIIDEYEEIMKIIEENNSHKIAEEQAKRYMEKLSKMYEDVKDEIGSVNIDNEFEK